MTKSKGASKLLLVAKQRLAAATQTDAVTGREPENNREDESGANRSLVSPAASCLQGGLRDRLLGKNKQKEKKTQLKKELELFLNSGGFRTLQSL